MQASSVFSCAMTCHRLPLLASVCHRWRQSPQAMRASDSDGYHNRLALLGWFPRFLLSLVAASLAIRWRSLPHRVLVAGFGMLKNIGAMAFSLLGVLFISPCTLGIAHRGKTARKKTNFFLCSFIQWFSGWLLYRRATGTTYSTMDIARRVPTMQAIESKGLSLDKDSMGA